MTLETYLGLGIEAFTQVDRKEVSLMLFSLREKGLTLPVYPGFSTDFYKSLGSAELPDYEKDNGKARWRLYVPNAETKKLLAKKIREHKNATGHVKPFTAADFKKPAMMDSNGKYKGF